MQNLSSLPPLTISYKGYSDPSFLDGNTLIFSKNNHVFRVHRSVLAHSSVTLANHTGDFKYIEGAKTLLVFNLRETTENLSLFLGAIYDGLYIPSSVWTPDAVKTVYRLATQYCCQILFHRCRSLLAQMLSPHSFAQLPSTLPVPPSGPLAAFGSDYTFQFRLLGPRTRTVGTVWSYYGVLARRSPVLRRIIEQQLSSGTLSDTGPVVVALGEETETVREFLTALHRGFYFEKPIISNMAEYTSVLKLAKCFDVAELRKEIEAQFTRLYPASFNQYRALRRIPSGNFLEALKCPEPLQLLLIAQECGLIQVLHEAHFQLTCSKPAEEEVLIDWTPPGKDWAISLSSQYARKFTTARNTVRDAWDQFIEVLSKSVHATEDPRARGGGCTQPDFCSEAFKETIIGTCSFDMDTWETQTDWTTLLVMLREEWGQLTYEHPCASCTRFVQDMVDREERRIWDLIPHLFGFHDFLGRTGVGNVRMVNVGTPIAH